jgi:hypothetical protein
MRARSQEEHVSVDVPSGSSVEGLKVESKGQCSSCLIDSPCAGISGLTGPQPGHSAWEQREGRRVR